MRSLKPFLLAEVMTLLIASPASATPCIGAALDIPFPTASAFQTRRADVPSPRFPGLWQEGVVQGYSYRIFANGDATLEPLQPEDGWRLFVSCDFASGACSREELGKSPAKVAHLATALENCFVNPSAVTTQALNPLLQHTVDQPPASAELALEPDGKSQTLPEGLVSEDAAKQSWALVAPLADDTVVPEPDPVNTDAPLPPLLPQSQKEALPILAEQSGQNKEPDSALQTTAIPAPCGLEVMPKESSLTLTLQRMLLQAGVDPGPLDGLQGPRTSRALRQVLGKDATALSREEAIEALYRMLCAPDN